MSNALDLRSCRGCGCDDDDACINQETGEPCAWVLLDIDTPTGICSECAITVGWNQDAFELLGRGEDAPA